MTDPNRQTDSSLRADEARHWIARLASGSIDENEMERFREWRAAPENDQIFMTERALWRELAAVESAFAPQRQPRPHYRLRPEKKRRRVALVAAATAAALAVILVPEVSLMLQADYRTDVGEAREIPLADGSVAFLDTDSAIAVKFSDRGRDIRLLSGRAWFNVLHGDDRPFRVAARGGITEDVGTAFEIDRSDDEVVKVGVTEGAVRILSASAKDGPPLTLTAGQHARYRKGQLAIRIDGEAASSTANWRDGELFIRNMPVEDALRAVSRYRNGRLVTLGDMSGLGRISGTFRTDSPDDALTTIADMRGLRLTYLPFGVVFIRPASSN